MELRTNTVILCVDDVDETARSVVVASVSTDGQTQDDTRGMHYSYLMDPGDHFIEDIYNTFLPLFEDGEFKN